MAADMIRLSGLRVGEDVDIEVVGLRPGEKLFEELHGDGEGYLPTRHPKIVVAHRERHHPGAVLGSIERLEGLADDGCGKIIEQLQRIVPEYRTDQGQRPSDKRAAA